MFRNEHFHSKKEETKTWKPNIFPSFDCSKAHFMLWKAFRMMKLFTEYFKALVDWQLARLNKEEILTSLSTVCSVLQMWHFLKFSRIWLGSLNLKNGLANQSLAISCDVVPQRNCYSKLWVDLLEGECDERLLASRQRKQITNFLNFLIRLTTKLETISLAASCCELLFSSATRLE